MQARDDSPSQLVYLARGIRRLIPRFSLRAIFLLLVVTSLVCAFLVWRQSRLETIALLEAKGYLVYSGDIEPLPMWEKPSAKGWEETLDGLQRWWYRPWGNRVRKLGDYEWIENVKPSYGQPSITPEEVESVLKALPTLVSIHSLNDDWWSNPSLRERLLEHKSLTSLTTQCLNFVPSTNKVTAQSSSLRSLRLFVEKQESLHEVVSDLRRCSELAHLYLNFSADSPVSLQGIGQFRNLTVLEVQNVQWPKNRGVGDRDQGLREPNLSIDSWEQLKELQALKLSQIFLTELDWNRVLQLPHLEQVSLFGCGSPNVDGFAVAVPSGIEIPFEIVASNPLPWKRLSSNSTLKNLELSCWMVTPEFADFANRSGIETIILQNWSYPAHQAERILAILSSIHPRVAIVLIRDYPILDDPYWQTATGSEKVRFDQLRFFESWAANQPNIRFGEVDF